MRDSSHQIALLNRLTTSLNEPRGEDVKLGEVMHLARDYFRADAGFIIKNDNDSLFTLQRLDKHGIGTTQEIESDFARILLSFPSSVAACFVADEPHERQAQGFDVDDSAAPVTLNGECELVATLLDAENFLTAPLRLLDEAAGRVFLVSHAERYTVDDVGFLQHLLALLKMAARNSLLIDQLTTHAAEQERKRIARDIHDSVIQPYIGLQLGLSALSEKVATTLPRGTQTEVKKAVERLLEMTTVEIAIMRRVVYQLRTGAEGENNLLTALQRFATKFHETTGISVHLVTPAHTDYQLDEKLAAEIFQMIAEGLSNIRRHTQAKQVWIEFKCDHDNVQMCLSNDGETACQTFMPQSIAERAAVLGGQTRVEQASGRTQICVTLPLQKQAQPVC